MSRLTDKEIQWLLSKSRENRTRLWKGIGWAAILSISGGAGCWLFLQIVRST